MSRSILDREEYAALNPDDQRFELRLISERPGTRPLLDMPHTFVVSSADQWAPVTFVGGTMDDLERDMLRLMCMDTLAALDAHERQSRRFRRG